jgi:site-specific DNA recombinase
LRDRHRGIDGIAAREACSKRHISMTISLAFLAPRLVKAAVDGRLPRGIGVARMRRSLDRTRISCSVSQLNPF